MVVFLWRELVVKEKKVMRKTIHNNYFEKEKV